MTDGDSPDLSVVVPAYNEERRLGPTLDAIRDHLHDSALSWELIVVDDGSEDGTAHVARRAAAGDHRIRLLAADRNRGKGHALRLGVGASRGARVLLTDADLATPVAELDRLAKELDGAEAAAAIGSRAHPEADIAVHQGRVREWLGRMGNRLIRAVAVPGIHDTQCGFKLFDGDKARAAFADARLDGWGIDVEILQYFRRHGWPVAEVPVRWSHQEGSKVGPADYGRVLLELVRLRARSASRANLALFALFLLSSVLLYKDLWTDLGRGYLADSGQDQNQWEWFFSVTADNVRHLRNPLFTTLQGFPDGVNLMGNTPMLGLSVPLAPVTLALGPTVTWALVLTLGLTATAYAWYRLFARWVTDNPWAAGLGGALAGFAPPMISHANAHPNFCVLFMIPVIVDRALRLCSPAADVRRDGVLLGLFTAYQIFLGEEVLLLASVGMLLFALSYALARRDVVREAGPALARGLGVAALVCLPLVAYPLTWQFFGSQSYHSVLHGDSAGNSPLSFLKFSGRALLGDEAAADKLALNRTEQNAFYGWPLIALAFAITVRLWRHALVKALAGTAVAAALLSLGQRIRIPYTDVVLPGPWRALAHRPLFESVIEGRVGMVCAPALGALVALAVGRLATAGRANRAVGLAAVALALLPIVPTPFTVTERAPVPSFFADGLWRTYVKPGESVVTVPLPDPAAADALHWQVRADLGFPLPGGYFNGPWGPDRIGIYGASPRWTSNLLRDVRYGGAIPDIGAAWRAQARADLEYWKAGLVVLPPQDNDEALYTTVARLLGREGQRVDGVWIWDVGR
ncbi:dolichyl-phosphate beta-glucosyltransferase [Streptomyces sp. BPTC-684]|uniref:dolichyl-phosphate beta-glucosyltransferase n=1 Tax=Streptomyces sp. BPTC-684 TaxID=3043734 RepID=UPI0024B12310|nr:dolichyl-phosphate beta-glucosyltransferase [Streptomyces sp. BPTC-684]WHM37983.1 glycosyltransferase family 2 protein [Streptomyces sp. BPTC-684]